MNPHDDRLLSLITHDLRNGLNAVSMAVHMIEGEVPEGHPDLKSDVQMLREGLTNLRRMLNHLSDYAQLLEGEIRPAADTFRPARILEEVVAEFRDKGEEADRIRLVLESGTPEVVELDPRRAFEALKYGVSNALSCGGDGEVVIRSAGGDGRWRVDIRDPSPLAPEASVTGLHPRRMERLLSNRRERQGIDLAIVAGVSDLFGGSARLESSPEQGTALVLDWPTRLPATPGPAS